MYELLIALRSSKGLIGCIALAAKLSEEPYSGEDRELLLTVAGHIGLALENVALLEVAKREAEQAKELDLARQVQQNLFPAELPSVAGWELAGICRLARQVGGDYFDLFKVSGDRFAIALGDVAGKGLGPAMVMSSVHTMIRSHLRRPGVGLPELMANLNEHLHASTAPDMFITLFLGLLAPDSGLFRFVNGGHNPGIVLRSHGTAERLQQGGLVVGIVPSTEFEQGEIIIHAGDAIVLFSDGVTEATNTAGEMFEEKRLTESLRSYALLDAASIVERIVSDVDGFAGDQEQADDISLVVIRRCL
ncbi:MAG: SpoIIE family protein phosphatase [Candidatus Latescibacteria bacterium]|nr:SpoIIE family protein phosphatase [Candidatus Latescibacterota bacterium]NIM20870.1 SpoIIE family protein phosphatase [Candidatus Latescibacterota bacterium]NIM65005.1 SpoIIE family protein phosphatase [Candidatus Latescibacterota bacterium]NIO01520.1 SpoIIE family protein phosphatase [Candidatus Latescibacterota bacterium]NIO28037.1 SpoIIE family protein phosphatase [Candidatus Latescibacterota bacterium]